MIEDLAKLLKVDTEGKNEEKSLELIEKNLLSNLNKETDLFNFISYYGLFSIVKLYKVWNWIKLDNDINTFYDCFIAYLENNKINFDEKYFNSLEESLNLYNFAYTFTQVKNKSKIFSFVGLINISNSKFLIYLCLCVIKIKTSVIFEYDDTFNDLDKINHFEVFQKFYCSIYKNLVSNIKSSILLPRITLTTSFIS